MNFTGLPVLGRINSTHSALRNAIEQFVVSEEESTKPALNEFLCMPRRDQPSFEQPDRDFLSRNIGECVAGYGQCSSFNKRHLLAVQQTTQRQHLEERSG